MHTLQERGDNTLALYAPNRFVLDWVRDKCLQQYQWITQHILRINTLLRFEVGQSPLRRSAKNAAMRITLHRLREQQRRSRSA